MRTPSVEKTELIARLKEEFKDSEPIFTEEILLAWNEYSRSRVFQLLRELCADGLIIKYTHGVYYFSETSFLGAPLPLDATKIAEKRYLKADGKVFGYYSGLALLNTVGLTNQVPNVREIVTTKETTRIREVSIGRARFLLRRAKAEVNEENAPLFQILEIFSRTDKPLEEYQTENILSLTDNGRIDAKALEECAKYFPKRALKNLKGSEIWSHVG